MIAKATSNAISVYLLDGAIDLCFGLLDGWMDGRVNQQRLGWLLWYEMSLERKERVNL
jgi:hypothetical protein